MTKLLQRAVKKNAACASCIHEKGLVFQIQTADGTGAFLSALRDQDLVIRGDLVEVMWFQGLTAYLQADKALDPH